MSKFYGKIGYITTKETSPGIWSEEKIEREYYGDVIRDYRSISSSEQLNDNLTINNNFSIVSDDFALNNLYYMKYIEYLGVKWKISGVEIQRPRLIISIGGIYNE